MSSSTNNVPEQQSKVTPLTRGQPPAGFNYNESGILVPNVVVPPKQRQRCKGCKCGASIGSKCANEK